MTPPRASTPLSPAVLHILLALSGDELHGYGIIQEVRRQTAGRYTIGPGTLYDNLTKLIAEGLVEDVRRTLAGEQRRFYRITRTGRSRLITEITSLEALVREANIRLHGARPKRA